MSRLKKKTIKNNNQISQKRNPSHYLIMKYICNPLSTRMKKNQPNLANKK